ncbi:MAG: glycosyltransferase [Mucilaginibacter sp.]|uniref:glycosyltransferase n=1 Tax=Mucilaginibacter sp. TaxID=1882438 RepID=UPI0034E52CA1
MDLQLLTAKPWKAVRVDGSPTKSKGLYWITRIKHKAAIVLTKHFGFNYGLAEVAIGRCTFSLLKEALKHSADLYIAHNLAALPVAVLAAKKNNTKCGFDAEDFHRNEVSNDPKDIDVKLKTYIEEEYFSQVDYLTASSFPIAQLYQKLFPAKKITTVLNAFSVVKEVSLSVTKPNEPLKLFWFSQTIGLNRGLQDVFSALNFLKNEFIELHILGFLNEKTTCSLNELVVEPQLQKKIKIVFHQPINPDQLPIFAAQFDVGLALEPNYPLNRNICLTNKIFTYLQAGLAVLASDTEAQKQFITENPNVGFCYEKGNAQQMAVILKQLIDQPELLLQTKHTAYQAARSNLNWETESQKFLKVVKETLAS